MAETHVVTCFLRNRSDILLLRRSEDVGSYSGQWDAVAGHAEGDPAAAARREIAEETGLADAVTLVCRGDPFPVEDDDPGTEWVVHPYLFDCDSRAVTPNYETADYEWVPPTEILRRETVPDLWTSYDRVRPRVETVATDGEHGSAYVSLRALDVLRDEAALAVERDTGDWESLVALAGDLLDARPAMTVVPNRVNRVMHAASTGPDDSPARAPAAVEAAASAAIADALDADSEAAATAAEYVGGAEVVTLSRSGTVRAALTRGDPESVLVAESRPGGEGVGVAESLAEGGVEVTLAPDAAIPQLVADGDYDVALVGADAVLPDGSVVNKVGTRALGLAGTREDLPVYAVAASDKISPDPNVHVERGDPAEIYDGDPNINVAVPLFDVTPPDCHDGLLTEDGLLDPDDIESIAQDHARRRDWQS